MFLRRFTSFVLQSRLQAMMVAFLFAYIPLLGVISLLIAALVTLRKSVLDGAFVICAATLPVILSYLIHPVENGIWLVGLFVASNFLTWLGAVLLRQYESWSLLLGVTLILGVVIVAITHFCYPNIETWWQTQITTYTVKSAETMLVAQPASQEALDKMAAVTKQYATGLITLFILLNALTQLALARWWQAIVFNPGGLKKELYQVRLGFVAGFIFVIGMVLAFLGDSIARDTMPVLFGFYCLAGLSLLHYLANLTQVAWLLLVLVYSGLIIFFPVSAMLIAILALLDTSMDFRKRTQSKI